MKATRGSDAPSDPRCDARLGWTHLWTLIGPASCVSCNSWCYPVNTAETHQTVHADSGMRYQSRRPTTSRSLVTLRMTLSRRAAAASEHELGEKAGGCYPLGRRFDPSRRSHYRGATALLARLRGAARYTIDKDWIGDARSTTCCHRGHSTNATFIQSSELSKTRERVLDCDLASRTQYVAGSRPP